MKPLAPKCAQDRKPPELWMNIQGATTTYRWMVWEPGPIGPENAHWFDTEDEAREFMEALGV